MNSERIKKLEAVSLELVSNYIFESLEDSEQIFWIITVLWVKISSDLSYLDIYVSSLKNWSILPKTLAKHNREIWQDVCETIKKECYIK